LSKKNYEFGVFYGNSLTPQNMYDGSYQQLKFGRNIKPQIASFIDIKPGDCIWIFETKVFCFECVNDTIKEYIYGDAATPDYLNDKDFGNVKVKEFKLINSFELYDVSEMFSSTSGHYGYNQKTIREFSNTTPQYKVCEALINKDLIPIDGRNFVDFLSPPQFETVSFMIFYLYGKVPRSHIGSTRKHVDLEVFDRKTNRNRLYQIKKKDISKDRDLDYLFENNIWTIHTGKTDFSKKHLGLDWVLNKICNHQLDTEKLVELKEWLRHLYPEELFEYTDVCHRIEGVRHSSYFEEFTIHLEVLPSALTLGDRSENKIKKISINEEGEINGIKNNHIKDLKLWREILDLLSYIYDGEDNTNDFRDTAVINLEIIADGFHKKLKVCHAQYNDRKSEIVKLADKLVSLIE
jgi:hypothetical protein